MLSSSNFVAAVTFAARCKPLPIYSSAAAAKSLQLCPTLCDPMNHSPPGSSVHEILQARILEWIAMPSFRGSSCSVPRDVEFSRTCADSKDLLAPPESSGTSLQFSRLLKALVRLQECVCFFVFFF